MSERLDPEEVKVITTQIFDKISKIVSKYKGFIEKYAGDAVMILLGAHTSHEDDPVRAIRAAREIHNMVDSLSPKYEESIHQTLSKLSISIILYPPPTKKESGVLCTNREKFHRQWDS